MFAGLPPHPQWLITSHQLTSSIPPINTDLPGSYHRITPNKINEKKKLSLFVFRYTLFVGLSLLFTGDSLSISDIRDI